MMKNTLILQGNPNKNSFVAAAAKKYYEGAVKSSKQVELIHLIDLNFDLVLRNAYKEESVLEPDLIALQKKIKVAHHIAIFYPIWWGTMPALVKGAIDRVFLPGFAFKYTKSLPEKLLTDKSATVVTTLDSPFLWYKLTGSPGHKAIKNSILDFCGFKPIKLVTFYSVKKSNMEKRKNWLMKIKKLGQRDAK